MPRLVRKAPLSERLASALNPWDFYLWASEEFETRGWQNKSAGTKLGLAFNFIFLLARANASPTVKDDIFGDDTSYGWVSFFAYALVWILAGFSTTNAFRTLTRNRKYRLFEADINVKPSTPSVRRVKMQSAPASPSVLGSVLEFITPESAESRAHADKAQDVWELSIWDPLPVSLQIFCLFGPGNVLVYLLFLPLASLDPHPSVTVFNTLALQVVLSGLLLFLSSQFAQQAKDHAIIEKEVMHEYDTKFVHPRLHPVVRDVGTQVSDLQPRGSRAFVQVGTPTTLIRRAFQTHANSNYSGQIPSVDMTPESSHTTNVMQPNMFTPHTATRGSDASTSAVQHRSALRKSLPPSMSPAPVPSPAPVHSPAPVYSPASASAASNMSPSRSGNPNFGGYMGAYTHKNSPLKKTTSLNDINDTLPTNSREMAAYENRNVERPISPLKRLARSPEVRRSTGTMMDRPPNQFAVAARNKAQQRERYPSRW